MRRRWPLLVVLSSACTSFGTATPDRPDGSVGAGQDGGAAAEASSETPGAASFCEKERRDPSVKVCLDFDEATSRVGPNFGFDEVSTTRTDTLQLEPSLLGTGAGNGVRFALADAPGSSRNASGHLPVLESSAFPAPNRLILDVDIVVDEMSLDYAVLAAFQVLGTSCGVFPGLALGPDGFHRSDAPAGPAIHPVRLGVPFHLRVIANPRAGQSTEEQLLIDGVSVVTASVAYDRTCSYAGVLVGTFFTSTDSGVMRARFDQIVVRTE